MDNAGSSNGDSIDFKLKKLREQEYFHFYLPREEVDGLLIIPGDFLVRERISADKSVTIILHVRTNKNLRIFPVQFNQVDNLFYFSENLGKPCVVELISCHIEKSLPVGNIYLGKAIPRKQWEILDDKVEFEEKLIDSGSTCETKSGKFFFKNEWVPMAYKVLDMTKVSDNDKEMKSKLCLLREFQIGRMLIGHKNILPVHGLFIGKEKLSVIMEPGIPLNSFIQNNPCKLVEKINFFMQAASGLSHMHKSSNGKLFVVKNVIKLAGFGFHTRAGPFYRSKSPLSVPFETLSLESLGDDPVWSAKSDSWSFGVFIFNVFQNCKLNPYSAFTIHDSSSLNAFLKRGSRLELNETIPIECRQIMDECFDADPNKRPEMADVHKRFEMILSKSLLETPQAQQTLSKPLTETPQAQEPT